MVLFFLTRRLFVITCLLIFVPASVSSKNRYVPKEHISIQSAIDSSKPGDTIWISEGEYFESLKIFHDVIIFAAEAGKCVIIPPDKSRKSSIYIKGNSTIIDGLTLDGTGVGAPACIVIEDGFPRLTRMIIKNSGMHGVVIKSKTVDNIPILKYNKIFDNKEVGIQVYMSALIIENNEIHDNGSNGISCIESTARIGRNRIYKNAGAGILIRKSISHTPQKPLKGKVWARILNNEISSNKEGGIICDKANPLIKGNKILVKTGKPDILLFSSSPIIKNNELESSGPPAIILMGESYPKIIFNQITGTLRFPIMGADKNVLIKNNEILSPWKKQDFFQ